jgi:hypothetical protein
MHITIPRALCRVADVSGVESRPADFPSNKNPETPARFDIIRGVYTSDDSMEIVDDPYFYSTHHRPLNDCVHSKRLVDGKVGLPPTMLVGSKQYRPIVYDYRGSYFEIRRGSFPPTEVGQVDILGKCPRDVYVNNKDHCYRLQMGIPDSYPGNTSVMKWDVYIDFYDACQSNYWLAKPKVFWRSCNIRIDYTMHYDSVVVFGRRYAWCWAEPTGNYRLRSLSGPQDGWSEIADYLIANMGRFTQYCYYSGGWTRYAYATGSSEIQHEIFDKIGQTLDSWGLEGYMSKYVGWRSFDYVASLGLLLPELVPYSKRFLLHEDLRVAEGLDAYLLSYDLTNYWHGVLVNEAYLDALDSVPRLNDNSISNILEIVGFIKSLVIDHRIEIPKSLGDMWLSYRYAYTTSKLDAEEAIEFVHRYRELGTLDQWIHCFGVSRKDISFNGFKTTATCRCGLEIRPSDVALLGKVWRALYTYGLQPNFYVLWDSLPYSFIVDWIIPLGNIAHALDAQSMYNGTYYEIKDVVFSISYDIVDEYANEYHQYTRWKSEGLPTLNGFYFLEEDPASTKVIGMRALDTLSLFIGKVK